MHWRSFYAEMYHPPTSVASRYLHKGQRAQHSLPQRNLKTSFTSDPKLSPILKPLLQKKKTVSLPLVFIKLAK